MLFGEKGLPFAVSTKKETKLESNHNKTQRRTARSGIAAAEMGETRNYTRMKVRGLATPQWAWNGRCGAVAVAETTILKVLAMGAGQEQRVGLGRSGLPWSPRSRLRPP